MVRSVVSMLLLCSLSAVSYATVQSDLRTLAGNHDVKVVWTRGGGEFGFLTRFSTNHALMKFDTKTGREDTICLADSTDPRRKSNVTRPVITHDGTRVVYSNAFDSTVWIINWDGSGKRRIGKGIAGCTWYDSANAKEYAIYAKKGSLECNNAIWRVNIADTTDALEVLPKSVIMATANQVINPMWIGVSKDGNNMVAGIGWPQIAMFNLTTKAFSGGAGGCWPSLAHDNTYRNVVFVLEHNGFNIITAGKPDTYLQPYCPWNLKECGTNQINLPKMSSNHPQYMSLIDSRTESTGQGPGNIMVFKFDPGLGSHLSSAVVTTPSDNVPKDGFSDVWIGDTIGATAVSPAILHHTTGGKVVSIYGGTRPAVRFTLNEPAQTTITVVSAAGRSITSINGVFSAGSHRVAFGTVGSGLRAGSYVVRMSVNGRFVHSGIMSCH